MGRCFSLTLKLRRYCTFETLSNLVISKRTSHQRDFLYLRRYFLYVGLLTQCVRLMFELGSEKIDKECGRFRESGGYPQKLMTTQRGKKPSSKDNPSQNSISSVETISILFCTEIPLPDPGAHCFTALLFRKQINDSSYLAIVESGALWSEPMSVDKGKPS